MEKNFKQKVPQTKLKSKLKAHFHYEKVKSAVEEELRQIPSLKENFKMDTSLTLVVCNILECMIPNNKKLKIDKSALCVRILSKIFELDEDEQKVVEGQIDFLHENKQIIKCTSASKCMSSLCAFFS